MRINSSGACRLLLRGRQSRHLPVDTWQLANDHSCIPACSIYLNGLVVLKKLSVIYLSCPQPGAKCKVIEKMYYMYMIACRPMEKDILRKQKYHYIDFHGIGDWCGHT